MSLFESKQERIRNKSSLVVYFSHTGENWMEDGIRNIDKGNTEIVAEKIQDIVNADLFKVEPVNKYPYNYHECCEVAKKELNKDERPELKNYLETIEEYEVIYIGGPVWWGHLPMPMFTLLEKLNFEGKIVKLFTTHEGSGLGDCPKDIERFCKGANIQKGLAIRGSNAQNSDNELENWIK